MPTRPATVSPAAAPSRATARPTRRRRVAAALVLAVAASALAGCAQTVTLEAADDAEDPGCAEVVVRLPDTVAEQPRRDTNAQGTGAWGQPTAVLLRCGVPPLGPTTDRCVSFDGVDFVIDETDAPRYRFTSYGRTPAVEIIVDNDLVSGTTAIADLAGAVGALPADGGCTDPEEAAPLG